MNFLKVLNFRKLQTIGNDFDRVSFFKIYHQVALDVANVAGKSQSYERNKTQFHQEWSIFSRLPYQRKNKEQGEKHLSSRFLRIT